MARKEKKNFTDSDIDRRNTGYYSTPDFVAEYIYNRLLELNPGGNRVLDTCVGNGELCQPFIENNIDTFGIDVIKHNDGIKNFLQADFIEIYREFKLNKNPFDINFESFCYVVANPPYNCHEVDYIKQNKEELKSVFSDVGVHNMYSMFISAMIDICPNGSFIGLITLDSFLTSKAHSNLRKKIMEKCTIHEITLCPTSLFHKQGADVRTCILLLEKKISSNNNQIRIINRPKDVDSFKLALSSSNYMEEELEDIVLSSDIDNNELMINVPKDIKVLFKHKRISDLFKCVTGISTGNDKKYIRKEEEDGFSIPFYKNPGSNKFYCKNNGFIADNFLEEKDKVKSFMVRNTSLIFKEGITCSSMGVEFSACYLPKNSTFGVNPNIICDVNDIWWLLSYLNSNLVKYIVRGVLIRSNMVTSGYVSRIPVPTLKKSQKNRLSLLAKEAYKEAQELGKTKESTMSKINYLIYHYCDIQKSTQDIIDDFCKNITRLT